MRQLLVTASFALAAQAAHAAEAGKIIFAAGSAQVVDRPAAEGARVQEGELLSTGPDGFIYVKTIDNGLFILRPNTRARIATYHVDAKNPANTRIKLELLSGVARSRSGEAVKLARQNFRFNTPVAAIGVRGTDFTVFTDNNTSRVAVISGGIVVSGFMGACRPEGAGPCEGTASRELSASQRGQLLQVQRGQAAPQLLQGGALGPDDVAPPRGDEPIGKNSGVNSSSAIVSAEPNLDAKKSQSLSAAVGQPPVVAPPQPVAPAPPPVETTPPPVTPPVVQPPELLPRTVVWGRWQPVIGRPAQINFEAEKSKSDLVAVNGNFVLFQTRGKDYAAPVNGSIGFQLAESEAYIYSTDGAGGGVVTPSKLTNGSLNVDFGTRLFTTAMDLQDGASVVRLQAGGAVSATGGLFGDSSYSRPGYMNVTGQLSSENGGEAAYVFDSRLDTTRTVNGVTYWQK
ncbi:hypothetical protein HHL21_08800 [Massilia sp. RP-1-19]|uniref:FecR protein domain-containing protein n=1 Tax=Massilia polaris TaxID=2728846 RepID=A0A848HJH1_9BURK|nr:hypothetical protein [Massilia polaris]